MSYTTDLDSLLAVTLPQISKVVLNLSIPYHSSVFSFHSGSGTNMHSSIDWYLHMKLYKKVFIDIDNFFTKFVLLISTIGIGFLNELSKNICNCFRNSKDWEILNTCFNFFYMSWLVGIMCGVCKHITQILQNGAMDIKNALNINNIQLVTDWHEKLWICKRATKPGVMKNSLAKRILDILLSVNDSIDCWDLTLVIGKHKSQVKLEENRKTIMQLAGYVDELFGIQSF